MLVSDHSFSRKTSIKSLPPPSSSQDDPALADELDYITVAAPDKSDNQRQTYRQPDKASRILGVAHRKSMEPIPASNRTSILSTRSVPNTPSQHIPTLPLTSLYLVSGLPKSPHTWTLADPDSVLGLHHSEGAVARWWRPEVLGSTVSPGAGGGKKKKKNAKGELTEVLKGAGALSKAEVGKMLSKALKLSFTREVEIIASTLQPASTIHTFTFTLPAPSTPLAPATSDVGFLRGSVLTADRSSAAPTFAYPYTDDPFANARPSSAYLGPSSVLSPHPAPASPMYEKQAAAGVGGSGTITYHGVCLTVWSHADAERSAAIRRTLEAGRVRKESAQSLVASRLKVLRSSVGHTGNSPAESSRRVGKRGPRGPWPGTDGETDGEGAETDAGAISESDFDVASTVGGHGPGESTLFLPGDTVFWLPYALSLVSRHPIYDLMRDYLTLSWARFSKDVQSHTLQISKILAHPAPRAGELIKLDASISPLAARSSAGASGSRQRGHQGLVDINFTMWPLFKCLNIDNVLTACEIALAPTGRVLFFSRYPAMLGIAVSTIKYLVELRLATEARYSVRPAPEVCVIDLDINYLSCPSPPPGIVSVKQQREKYRLRFLAAFEPHYHPDHSIPSEFKEAFPAGRFRPVCKVQAKRGGEMAAVADTIKPPEWWHSTRIIQAFDAVLEDRFRKPSLFKRLSSFGTARRLPRLSAAEQHIQLSIRKRATAFVDARDDLETRIGRLSRRLNFLMTEADLWRDKFVTFEQYAEKLSVEADQLRGKIGKEQRETKRLSGLVTLTAAEKAKLQSRLFETERAHKDALMELERMREAMDHMEQERAEMVAEVEAQIERALASMAIDVDESDYGGELSSRPASRMSTSARSASGTRSRRASDATKSGSHESSGSRLRSIGTESTLAESYERGVDDTLVASKSERETDTIAEEEEAPVSPIKKKRFSATQSEVVQDGMTAVDEGISERSDRIAQKVLQIQHKLETALASENIQEWKKRSAGYKSPGSDYATDERADESSDAAVPVRPRHPRGTKLVNNPPIKAKRRERSDTGSTNRTGTGTIKRHSVDTATSTTPRHSSTPINDSPIPPREDKTPVQVDSETDGTDLHTPTAATSSVGQSVRKAPSAASLTAFSPEAPTTAPTTPALTPSLTTTTDESDTDFQSACSASPRDSCGSFEGKKVLQHDSDDSGTSTDQDYNREKMHVTAYTDLPLRARLSSTATAVPQSSPTLSDVTAVPSGRSFTARSRQGTN
ncbi:DENN domain-containing protein [Boletus reticuloceps]|uniref:DENN domain-containing protein n=1 Tax=Boletus reticuloceps TaxID=495285 RepID=A0A8I2YZX0_9AGAM|nr:DENN domain-containing protein [Boletus reticuloceps]